MSLLAEACSTRRDARVRFLMAQIEILRNRMPGNRVIVTPEERLRLIKLGGAVGHETDDLIGIVSVKTYKRWLRDQRSGKVPGRVGRPRKMTASVRELILRLARENAGWGVRRIVGELRKLALTPSRSSVRRVLVDEGVMPDPDRHAPKGVTTPWRTFVKMHVDTIVACDFFCKNIWTLRGKRVAYNLMVIHLGSRKVFVSPATYHPNEEWGQQQARNVSMWLDDEELMMDYLLRDRDTKFAGSFDATLKSTGANIVRSPYQSPIANCYAESWIGTLKRECLKHFSCFGLRHLDHIIQTYADYYNRVRPHQSKDNRPLSRMSHDPIPIRSSESLPHAENIGAVQRHELLGGLLNHYERKAA